MSLLEAYDRGDPDAFDDAVEALGGARPMLDVLLERTSADERARARACLPAGISPYGDVRLDVRALALLDAVGLWESSAWVLAHLPTHDRRAPSPIHEQWDAILGIHAARIEAPWLPIELLASLDEAQRSLGRRVVLGLERRFGARAWRVAERRARMSTCALDDLLRPPR